MRIVHLSTADVGGGAAFAARRLHTGLRRLNQDSSMFVLGSRSDDPAVVSFKPPMSLFSRLRRRWRRWRIDRIRQRIPRPNGHRAFSTDRSPYDGGAVIGQFPPCDVLNLHWISGFVDYQSFFGSIPQQIPIVWTVHDMNPFTGGCHYDQGCGGYTGSCGACPELDSTDEYDLSRRIWRRKHEALEQIDSRRMHIVGASQWTADECNKSSLLGRFSASVIPHGLDTDAFSSRDHCVAREVLGVPQKARVVLFVSGSTDWQRKGFVLLDQALADLESVADLFLLSVGQGKGRIDAQIPQLHLGFIGDDRLLSLVYSAADVFVAPSLQEAFGLTVLEAMACGTPIVGFAVGGILDMVRPGVTGVLTQPGDVDALRAAIVQLLQDPAKRAKMSDNCRRIAVQEYALEVQARQYVEVYRALQNSIDGSS